MHSMEQGQSKNSVLKKTDFTGKQCVFNNVQQLAFGEKVPCDYSPTNGIKHARKFSESIDIWDYQDFKPCYPSDSHIAMAMDKYGIDFPALKYKCEKNLEGHDMDFHPSIFSNYRKHFWPSRILGEKYQDLQYIYSSVIDSGIPNCLGERLELPTNLNLQKWQHYLPDSKYRDILDWLRFGVPLGYCGPVAASDSFTNHPSALKFPSHVDEYIEKELSLGAIIGPFESPPFEWIRQGPILTREKSDGRRRIVIDLSFPSDTSINAYIKKNTIMGVKREFGLPNVDQVVECISQTKGQAYLFSCDISNCYKNLSVDPQFWPLLVIFWKEKYYVEVKLPFGARNAACFVQMVAEAILDILRREGICGFMYLDDVITISAGLDQAKGHAHRVQQLLNELGLPLASHKNQGPATDLVWLGVKICAKTQTLSVPKQKLDKIIKLASSMANKKRLSKKNLQSIMGKINHIAKCILPARIFTSRILEVIRTMASTTVEVTQDLKEDLLWFSNFASEWNGCSKMNLKTHTMTINTYVCLPYLSASNGTYFYILDLSENYKSDKNEEWVYMVMNCCIAIEILCTEENNDSQIHVFTQDCKVVSAFTKGNTRNRQVDQGVRTLWFHQAFYNRDHRIMHQNNDTICQAQQIINLVASAQSSKLEQWAESLSIINISVSQSVLEKYNSILSCRPPPKPPDEPSS